MQQASFVILVAIAASGLAQPDVQKKAKVGKRPSVNVTYYLSAIEDAKDRDALRAALEKVKSVSKAVVSSQGEHVTVQFDSHVVSYHQIAQAIIDAGTASGKKYAPRLKLQVPDYAKNDNAAKVDAIFNAKRLNQLVRIEATDKAKGEFILHFLPLQIDPADGAPQGFNGGHLNHPIHDAPPAGLGLLLRYVTESNAEGEPKK
jgi:copper chaperone CopZ